MSDPESIIVLGLLVLLAFGIVLMFAPSRSGEEQSGLVLREIEPQVGEGDQLIDFRYSLAREVQESLDSVMPMEALETQDEEEDALPVNYPEDDFDPDESVTQTDDELFYLVATDEVDSDQRQPALWAKVMALNSGDEQKARFHYIRLRAARMVKNQPPTHPQDGRGVVIEVTEVVSEPVPVPTQDGETGSGLGTVAKPEPVAEMRPVAEMEPVTEVEPVAEVKRTAGLKPAARAAQTGEFNGFAPILNHDLVMDVVNGSRMIGSLIRSADLLRDFSVSQYVTSEDIQKSRAGHADRKPGASSFFDNYQHRTSVSLGDSLERFDKSVVRSYLLARQFPHQLAVDFFDEAVVITILPGSPQMEFLVLVPGGGLGDPFSARFLASSRITELFMAAASENQNPLSLYIELDLLLERLRIG